MSKISRRTLLGASGGALAAGAVAAAERTGNAAAAPASASLKQRSGPSGVSLRWLGNNAWEIGVGDKTILIDPWLTRFYSGAYTDEGADPATPLTVDPSKIDPYVQRADVILIGHGHYDHITDIPYIARKTGATVLGTESHLNLLRAMSPRDQPLDDQLCTVRGGERLDFDGFTLDVFESLHSMGGPRRAVPFAGTRTGPPPPPPQTIADLVEGGVLAYQITAPSSFRIVALSSGNFIERELSGLRPDLAIVPTGGGSVHDYAGRLMRALGKPRWVLPTHWDDYDEPLDRPAVDIGSLQPTRKAILAASPRTRFVTLDHLETFTP